MSRKVKEAMDIGKDAYLQRAYHIESNLHSVDLNYLNGMCIFTMMATEDENQAERFYELIKQAYEEMIY